MPGLIVTHIVGCMTFNAPRVLTKKQGTNNNHSASWRTTASGHEKGDLCYQPVIQTTTHHSCGVHSVLSVMSTTQHLDVSSEAHLAFMI